MIGKLIDFKVFIISLAVGLFLVYIHQQQPTTIYVYPTPDNVNKLSFKDKANNCYAFDSVEVACPSDPNNIATIPMQN
jgi:hypothetical protein